MWEDNNPPQDPPKPEHSHKDRVPSRQTLIKGAVIMGGLLVAATAVYFFLQYQKAQKLLATESNVLNVQREKKESESLIKEIGKLAHLPTNETPTVATITDKTKLRGQDFFEKAENGDKVLIYTNNRVALIYRPSIKKIINFATKIAVSTPTPVAGKQAAPTVAGVSTAPTQAPSPTQVQFIPTSTPTPTGDSGLIVDLSPTPSP